MPPGLNLPASLLEILSALRPCFTARAFVTFCGLAAGLAGQTRRRTVTGMLLGACLQRAWPHDRAHYFFARARWELDQPGLGIAQAAVLALVPPGADLRIAVDDSVFRRAQGLRRRVAARRQQPFPGQDQLRQLLRRRRAAGQGPVLQPGDRPARPGATSRAREEGQEAEEEREGRRREAGGEKKQAEKGPSKVDTAAALVTLLACAFPDRTVHAAADAACHGPALRKLPANVTWTCRIPRNAKLYALAPPRTGKRGRPWTKGACPGEPGDIAKAVTWQTRVTRAYGRDQVKHAAEVTCLRYGSFKDKAVRLILPRDEDTAEGYGLALVTTGLDAGPAALVTRYAGRWETGQASGDARNVPGAGEARNRVQEAVERTIPFAMLIPTIVVIWYARHGHDPAGIDDRREQQPWYAARTEPAFEDMLAKLRRVLITARIPGGSPAQPTPDQIRAVTAAWTAAAA